ncbi:MAG: hypothetical protein EBU29_04385 [Gammaproteobacteria bacterium]|nr:hypothetical protein [Gammaproteobacteria bacterium]
MTYIKPAFRHPKAPVNDLGWTRQDYEGGLSTLCAGCGHDSISAAIVDACFQLNIEPHRVAKLSGIGCSSKTPAYFLSGSHSFNSVHGRMPSVATGANLANRDLIYIGVSGDGDTASIGLGQFAHGARRNLNMTYIVENNGCYGLTKGQDSATMDTGSVNKKGDRNLSTPMDVARLAIEVGATFVGRSFSGDKEQLVPLIKAQDSDHDIEDRQSALQAIAHYESQGKVLTGLLYIDRDSEELHDQLGTARRPLNTLTEQELCPGSKFLDSINAGLR